MRKRKKIRSYVYITWPMGISMVEFAHRKIPPRETSRQPAPQAQKHTSLMGTLHCDSRDRRVLPKRTNQPANGRESRARAHHDPHHMTKKFSAAMCAAAAVCLHSCAKIVLLVPANVWPPRHSGPEIDFALTLCSDQRQQVIK